MIGGRERGRRVPLWRNSRVWLAAGITGLTLWLTVRGISFSEVVQAMARADLVLLLGVSIPAHVVMIWLRALRWRHLTDAVCPIERGPLFRATAVGFMANNVFPLRIGEFVRAWYLAREVPARAAALFGTVVLERVIDALLVVGLAFALFGFRGVAGGKGPSLAVGLPLALGAALPLGAVAMLRAAPERTIELTCRVLGPLLPARMIATLKDLLARIAEGFGSLQGGRHLIWVTLHSVLIWLVLAPIPFGVALVALGVDLGSPQRFVAACYVALAAVGIAVSVPSAPGFFGPYHWACREALSLFGVAPELSVALGTLVHAVFWVTASGLGLLALRVRPARLEEMAVAVDEPGKGPSPHRR